MPHVEHRISSLQYRRPHHRAYIHTCNAARELITLRLSVYFLFTAHLLLPAYSIVTPASCRARTNVTINAKVFTMIRSSKSRHGSICSINCVWLRRRFSKAGFISIRQMSTLIIYIFFFSSENIITSFGARYYNGLSRRHHCTIVSYFQSRDILYGGRRSIDIFHLRYRSMALRWTFQI